VTLKKIRTEFLYKTIVDFQEKQHLHKYPLNLFELCRKNGWKLIPYDSKSELSKISKDGFSQYEDNEFYIFYNKHKLKERINFTIGHEVGHIVINHHIEYGKSFHKDPTLQKILEQEADIFSRNLIAPAHVINVSLIKNDPILISEYCLCSKTAAKMRIRFLKTDCCNTRYSEHFMNSVLNTKCRLSKFYSKLSFAAL